MKFPGNLYGQIKSPTLAINEYHYVTMSLCNLYREYGSAVFQIDYNVRSGYILSNGLEGYKFDTQEKYSETLGY